MRGRYCICLFVGKKTYIFFVFFIMFFGALNVSNVAVGENSHSIAYFDAHPYAQGKNGFVNIICVINDDIDVERIELTIIAPNGAKFEENMMWSSENKYVFEDTYDILGKYSFYAEVFHSYGDEKLTSTKHFWITLDLDDTDMDGMPNWWEEKYNFDPEYVVDAHEDFDGDGYTNFKEYEIGTNPVEDVFIQNAAFRFKDNVEYVSASVSLFIILLFFSFYGIKRW